MIIDGQDWYPNLSALVLDFEFKCCKAIFAIILYCLMKGIFYVAHCFYKAFKSKKKISNYLILKYKKIETNHR